MSVSLSCDRIHAKFNTIKNRGLCLCRLCSPVAEVKIPERFINLQWLKCFDMFSIDPSNHMRYSRGTCSTTLALENAESIAKQVWMAVSYGKFAWMDVKHPGFPAIRVIAESNYNALFQLNIIYDLLMHYLCREKCQKGLFEKHECPFKKKSQLEIINCQREKPFVLPWVEEGECFKVSVVSNYCNKTNNFTNDIALGNIIDNMKFKEKNIIAYPFELKDTLHLCNGWLTEYQDILISTYYK